MSLPSEGIDKIHCGNCDIKIISKIMKEHNLSLMDAEMYYDMRYEGEYDKVEDLKDGQRALILSRELGLKGLQLDYEESTKSYRVIQRFNSLKEIESFYKI